MQHDMIIFDVDGTLWEATDIVVEAMEWLSTKYPEIKRKDIKIIQSIMGLPMNDLIPILMPEVDKSEAVSIFQLLVEKDFELIQQKGAHLYADIPEVVATLSQKYKLGIVTNNYNEYAEIFLDKSGLKKYFSDYIGASTLRLTKAQAISEMVKRNKSRHAVYIGDIEKDLFAAQEANVDFIHARYGFGKNVKCDKHIDSARQLLLLL